MNTDTPRTDKAIDEILRCADGAMDLQRFTRKLERENARLRQRRITQHQLEDILTQEGIVPFDAVEFPEAYDSGATELAISVATQRINELLASIQQP